MKPLIGAIAGLWAGLASVAFADMTSDNQVVVELFTSQGCSSCPPADAILSDLAPSDDVIALALHVDYWDYLGWKDEFADPRNTRRQKSYARVAGARTVYTPQMVVGGKDHLVGVRPVELMDLIERHAANPAPVLLSLSRSGDKIDISATAAGRLPNGAVIQLVRYTPRASVDIRGGENGGRTITYANIVRSWEAVGEWDGSAPLSLSVPVRGGDPVVVILQEPGPGPILAAARLR